MKSIFPIRGINKLIDMAPHLNGLSLLQAIITPDEMQHIYDSIKKRHPQQIEV